MTHKQFEVSERRQRFLTGLFLAVWLGLGLFGCAGYERSYRTVGGEPASADGWNFRLNTDYVDGTVVGLSAWIDESADRMPLLDELLQIDYLVVVKENGQRRRAMSPAQAIYAWGPVSQPGGGEDFAVQMVDSARCLASRNFMRNSAPGEQRPVFLKEYRKLLLDPPSLQKGSLDATATMSRSGPLDILVPITFDEIRDLWDLRSHILHIIFEAYGRPHQRDDRRLELYVWIVDRRTAEVLSVRTLEFDHVIVGKWKFTAGV